MGGFGSKGMFRLKESELIEFSNVSTFSQDEINDLYGYYRIFSMVKQDDGVIDYDEFLLAA